MQVSAADATDIEYVALRMRDSDLREFLAVHDCDGRVELAGRLARIYGPRSDVIVAGLPDEPIAIGALVEARPRVLTLMFFATDRLPQIALPLTRFIRNNLFPKVQAAGTHRIECVSIAGHREAHRWIQVLGLDQEAVCRGYGKDGETFHQFAWVAGHVGKADD